MILISPNIHECTKPMWKRWQVHAMHLTLNDNSHENLYSHRATHKQLVMHCLSVCDVHGSKRHFLTPCGIFSLWPTFLSWLLYLTMATQTFSATINVATLLYYFDLIGPVPRQAKKLWLNLQWNSIQHQMSSSVFWLVGVVLLESAQILLQFLNPHCVWCHYCVEMRRGRRELNLQ